MKNKIKVLIFIFCLVLIPGVTFAYDLKLEESSVLIAKDEIIEDDVIATGETITVDGTINGDLKAFGANIIINGDVNGNVIAAGSNVKIKGLIFGDLIVAGGTVELEGEVADDLMMAGGTLDIDGEVRDNAMAAGGMISMSERAKVGRDLLAGGGMINMSGLVKRNLTFSAGQLVVAGKVGGNLEGRADEKVSLEAGSEIDGNLDYKSQTEAEIKEGAEIAGEKKWEEAKSKKDKEGKSIFSKILWKIYSGLALFLVAIIALLIFPEGSKRVVDNIKSKPGKSILYGLIIMAVMPLVLLIITVTIIGIPLSIILGVFYAVLFYISKIFAAIWAGKKVLGYLGGNNKKKPISLFLSAAVGIIMMYIVFLIPIVGFLAKLILIMFGLGAICICVIDYYNGKMRNKNLNKKAQK